MMYPENQVTISLISAPFIAVSGVCLPEKRVKCLMAELYLSQVLLSSNASDHLYHHSDVLFFCLRVNIKTMQVDKNQLVHDLQNSFSCQ